MPCITSSFNCSVLYKQVRNEGNVPQFWEFVIIWWIENMSLRKYMMQKCKTIFEQNIQRNGYLWQYFVETVADLWNVGLLRNMNLSPVTSSQHTLRFLNTSVSTSNNMGQIPCWRTNSFSAFQAFPRTLWSPEVLYPPPDTVLSQIKPVQTIPTDLLNTCFNIILPSTPRSSELSLSLRIPNQKPYTHFFYPHSCHMSHPSLSFWLDHPDNMLWLCHIMKLLIIIFPSVPCFLIPLRPDCLSQHPVLDHP